jgi:hypothetical protein
VDCHQAFLPNKPRGVLRVNDRRVLNGIFLDIAVRRPMVRRALDLARPATTGSFVGGLLGIRDLIMEAFAEIHDGSVQMIDTSIARVHQHGGCAGGAKQG